MRIMTCEFLPASLQHSIEVLIRLYFITCLFIYLSPTALGETTELGAFFFCYQVLFLFAELRLV